MQNRDLEDEGGQSPWGKPNQSDDQKGTENDRASENRGGEKESAGPSSSGVPHEGREGSQKGQHRYSFKGGRPGPGDAPNPDDSVAKSPEDETRNPA